VLELEVEGAGTVDVKERKRLEEITPEPIWIERPY